MSANIEEFARNLWDALAVTDDKLPTIVAHVSEYLQQGDKSDPDLEALVEKLADRWPVWVYGSDGKPVKDVISQELLALVKEVTANQREARVLGEIEGGDAALHDHIATQQAEIERLEGEHDDLVERQGIFLQERRDLKSKLDAMDTMVGLDGEYESDLWAQVKKLREELATSKRRVSELEDALERIVKEPEKSITLRCINIARQALSEPADGDQPGQQAGDDGECEHCKQTMSTEVLADYWNYALHEFQTLCEECYQALKDDIDWKHPDQQANEE